MMTQPSTRDDAPAIDHARRLEIEVRSRVGAQFERGIRQGLSHGSLEGPFRRALE